MFNFFTRGTSPKKNSGGIFSFKKKKKQGSLALDIGTDMVKALICVPDHKKQCVDVLGMGRQRQKLGDMYNGGIIDIDSVMKNAEEAIREAEIQAGITASDVIVGIAGELVKGATVSVEYIREQPKEEITLPELKNMVHKVQWKAFEQIRRELSWETGYSEIDVKLVHTALVDVRVDGYRVSNPLGFKGKHVQVGIFNAFAPLVHFDSLRAVAEGLGKELLSIVVEPYAVSRATSFEDGGDVSALFVDIGGGTTDVAIVQNGGIVGTRMYGIGGRVFTKRIAKHMGIPFLQAEEMKLKYSGGQLKGRELKEVEKLIKEDVDTWEEALCLALNEFMEVDILPAKLLLSGGGSLLPELSQRLMETAWYKGLKFARKPMVSFLTPPDITNVVDHTKKLATQQDVTPMALASLLLDLSGEEKLLSKILRQVTRVVST